MYDCLNEGIAYLKEKLGKNQWGYLVANIIPNSEEHSIHLLLQQYYYGIEAKKELYYKLIELGVIKEE
jgi:hypothetical protein